MTTTRPALTIRTAIDADVLLLPGLEDWTLDGVADEIETAIRAAYPDARVIVERHTGRATVEVTAYDEDGDLTYRPDEWQIETTVREITGETVERLCEEEARRLAPAVAYLDTVSPYCDTQHRVDTDRVGAIVAHVEAVGTWDLPPILVIESEGNGATLLDGHHRAAAAISLGLASIPAWIVSVADYCRVVEAHFGGEMPQRISDLDDHIPVSGRPYQREGLKPVADDPRYAAHARRQDVLRRATTDPLVREYLAGYRAGMARSTRTAAPEREDTARDRLADAALAGELDTPGRLAYGCGYHDGREWRDPTRHRGLIRLAAYRQTEGSVRGLARTVLDVNEGSLRGMLSGARPIPAALAQQLHDALTEPPGRSAFVAGPNQGRVRE